MTAEWIIGAVLFALFGVLPIGIVLSVGAHMFFAQYVTDLRYWKHQLKALEAERMVGMAGAYTDDWAAKIHARIEAHKHVKPELPWPLGDG